MSEEGQANLEALRLELRKDDFDDNTLAPKLLHLRICARIPAHTPVVYCRDGLNVLAEAAFGSRNRRWPASSLEAARIIANALLLQDTMQQVFAGLGYTKGLLDFYSSQDADHEFVGGRILFLLTYKSKLDFVTLIESQSLIEVVLTHLNRHTSCMRQGVTGDTMHKMALGETLKLLYNLSSKNTAQMHFFSQTVETLVDLLSIVPLPEAPLGEPVNQLLNALAIIDWPTTMQHDKTSSALSLLRRLVKIVDGSVSTLKRAQLETMLVPVITVLRKVKELSYPEVDGQLKKSFLPQDEERDKPLGHGQSLAARLLRLSKTESLTILPEAISGLMFDLSDRNATKFVQNIGYGNAAGYLMNHKIPVPEGLKTTTLETSSVRGNIQINPITGQRTDAEIFVSMPEMTDEDKEREAQRLYVLFERLQATGVVNVENPLKYAQQSGKLEELSDSEPD